MGYLYAFLVALLYSTTGLLSKTAGGTLHPVLITLGRFVFGAGCMALLLLAQKKRIRLHFLCAPILGGSACKTLNFLTENAGVSLGYSYGNMVIWPMQTVFTLLFSLFLLREKASARQWLGTGRGCHCVERQAGLRHARRAHRSDGAVCPLWLFLGSVHAFSEKADGPL